MSALAPKGHLPARIYWVRRLLVLGVGLALVFGLAQLLGVGRTQEPGGVRVIMDLPSQSSGAPAASPTSTPARTPAPAATEPTTAAKNGTSAKATQAPLPTPSGPCAREDIVATPEVVGTAYAGRPVRFRIDLTTRTTPACTWTASSTSLAVKIVSGDDRIWSSQDCPAAVSGADVVVREEVPAAVRVTWRGQRSDDTCSRLPDWAQPGWYHVEAATFGGDPTDVQFELRTPVARTITASPKPEKQDPGEPQESPAATGSAAPRR